MKNEKSTNGVHSSAMSDKTPVKLSHLDGSKMKQNDLPTIIAS